MSTYVSLVVRHARASKGLTQEKTGEAVHVSPSLIAMFETGRRLPHPDTARRLDELLETGTLISDVTIEARKEHQPEWLRPWTDLEPDARTLRGYEPAVVPGLLQTEAYARAVLACGLLAPEQAETHVTLRLERQAVVLDRADPPVATFIIDEDALRRGDPDVRKEQLLHLIELGERPRVLIHVVPAGTGFYTGQDGPFVLAALNTGETIGFVDDQLQGRVVNQAQQVAALEAAWQLVCGVALPCDLSRQLMLRLVDEL